MSKELLLWTLIIIREGAYHRENGWTIKNTELRNLLVAGYVWIDEYAPHSSLSLSQHKNTNSDCLYCTRTYTLSFPSFWYFWRLSVLFLLLYFAMWSVWWDVSVLGVSTNFTRYTERVTKERDHWSLVIGARASLEKDRMFSYSEWSLSYPCRWWW